MAEEPTNAGSSAAQPPPPGLKQMKPGQTVCNQRDAKGKLCAGPLKRMLKDGYRSKEEIEGMTITYRCGKCYTLYQGPPLGYLRDPKMGRFVLSAQPDIVQPPPAPAHEPAKKEAPAKPPAEAKPAAPAAEAKPAAGAKPGAETQPLAEAQPAAEAKPTPETKPLEG